MSTIIDQLLCDASTPVGEQVLSWAATNSISCKAAKFDKKYLPLRTSATSLNISRSDAVLAIGGPKYRAYHFQKAQADALGKPFYWYEKGSLAPVHTWLDSIEKETIRLYVTGPTEQENPFVRGEVQLVLDQLYLTV